MVNNKTDNKSVDTKKSLMSFFKLGPHNTMERFCFLFIMFMTVFLLIILSSIHQRSQRNKITLTNQSIYGGDTVFSLTQDTVNVEGLWTNEGCTKAFILLHIPNGMTNLSTRASDYAMFMTGVNTELDSSPTGSIYVFGSTGYIGLGFTNAAGFKPAAYDIVLRNMSYISEGYSEAAANMYTDESFQYHNQCRIVANFAASEAKIANFYSKVDYTANDIYKELIQSDSISDVIVECDEVVEDINASMVKANEYARRLDDAGISIEEPLPSEIYGSNITTEPLACSSTRFDSNYMLYMPTGNINDADGSFKYVDTRYDTDTYKRGDRLYYNTDYVFPGGINLEYYNLTADSDLLSDIIPAGTSYKQFIEQLNEEAQIYTVNNGAQFGKYIDSRDGTVFSKNDTMDVVNTSITGDISGYESAVSAIFNDEKKLQTDLFLRFLKIYYDSSAINDVTSVYMGDDVLTMY